MTHTRWDIRDLIPTCCYVCDGDTDECIVYERGVVWVHHRCDRDRRRRTR